MASLHVVPTKILSYLYSLIVQDSYLGHNIKQMSDNTLDPDLALSEHTLNALKEFLSENSWRLDSEDNQNNEHIEENWVIICA